MTTPTKVALLVIGVAVVAAIIVISRGPAVIPMPKGPFVEEPSTQPSTKGLDLKALSESETRSKIDTWTMPAFQGITAWWNTPDNGPLTPEQLKGRVVMVKFWTYSCINCIRTYPYIKRWVDLYADDGFVLVGVHTPEFAFEAVPKNVEAELKKNGFTFPVALDPDYGTWNAYDNHYWPAEYLFDAKGVLRYTHFGEGHYDVTEQAIAQLLKEAGLTATPRLRSGQAPDENMPMPTGDVAFEKIGTHETYFGYDRVSGFANVFDLAPDRDTSYTLKAVNANQWSIGGTWRIENERSVAVKPDAVHRFNVQAPVYNIVMDAPEGTAAKIRVTVDGKPLDASMMTEDAITDAQGRNIIIVNAPRLYRITNLPDGKRHTVEIEVLDGEVRFYAATFG